MLTLKRARLWFISLVVVATITNVISPLIPKAYANTATAVNFNTKDLPFTRINRTLITIGNGTSGVAWFYSADPLGDNYVYNSVGLTCPATLTYSPASGGSTVIPSSWTITWTSPYQSQDGCQTVKSTVNRKDDPKNNGVNERFWTVFYENNGKIYSVLKDNKTTFTKYTTAVMPSGTPEQYAYIEDGVQAVDCPSVIRYSAFDSKWAYIPMTKASSDANASDQYRTLMNKAFGTPESDVQCTPVDKDDLGLLKRFGLPESYYDRGTVNKNNIETNFGFSGKNLYGAELLGGVRDVTAQGIGANGDYANGSGIGTGGGVVDETAAEGSTSAPTCTIEGIGWIVCPVTKFLASVADGAMGMLNDFFNVPAAKIFDTSGDTYKIWQQVRNYANIMFVIAFLIIIFSQVTSIGITNYGIKKLLPKLIATAILVNISFPICAILVDLSNLLGYNLAAFMGTSISNATGVSANPNGWNQASTFGGIVSTVLIGGAVLITAYFALASIVGVLISVVVIGVTMVVLLGIRQALIVLLVVLAPLAFVALLLPNTESLFKKWLNLFKSMLLIFPIASLLYGAGLLASKILMQTSDNSIVQTIGASLPVVMLIAIYKVFNSTMNAVNGVGDFANGLRKGLNKVGSPLKSLAGASDKLNRQRFMAGEGPVGLRNLGRYANKQKAGYDAKLKAAKDQTDANASSHVRNNAALQKYVNQAAAATQQNKANQLAIQNAGRQHVLDEHRDSLEDEGKQKEKEREISEKEQTVQINASGMERALADVAAKIKGNTEQNAKNESLESMQGSRPDLIAREGELQQVSRRLENVSKTIQASDDATEKEFTRANEAEMNTKEAEATRDATWQEHVKDSPDLVEQKTRTEGQQLRGKAAEETVSAAVKENMEAGTMDINDGRGGTVSLREVRENMQDAEMEIKRSEAAIKEQDTHRAATDANLQNLREGTLIADKETQRNEAKIQAQDEELVAQDAYLTDVANETRAQQNRAGEAKRQQAENYREAIINDPTLLSTAGGTLNPQAGQQRAQAAARAEVSRARAEVITNARVQFETASNNAEALSIATTGNRSNGTQATAEEIEAASLHLLEKGAHGDKLEVIRQIATSTGSLPLEQQQAVRGSIADAYVRSSLADLGGKNFAAEIRNPAASPSFDTQIRSNLATLKPEALAKDSKYAETVLQLYNSATPAEKTTMEPMLNGIVSDIRGNSTLSSSADPRTKTAINNLTTAMGAAYTGSPDWS